MTNYEICEVEDGYLVFYANKFRKVSTEDQLTTLIDLIERNGRNEQ